MVKLTDGDGHVDAIAEMKAIALRGGDFPEALGDLMRQRQDALAAGKLDDRFEFGPPDSPLASVNHCAGKVGVTAVYSIENDELRLLSVVAFDDFFAEALNAVALSEALARAESRR